VTDKKTHAEYSSFLLTDYEQRHKCSDMGFGKKEKIKSASE